MKIERAKQVVSEVIEQRKRWGHKLSASDFNPDDLLDALVTIETEGVATATADLTKSNRQTAAAKAQASRWHKKMKAAEILADERGKRIKELKKQIEVLQDVIQQLEARLVTE